MMRMMKPGPWDNMSGGWRGCSWVLWGSWASLAMCLVLAYSGQGFPRSPVDKQHVIVPLFWNLFQDIPFTTLWWPCRSLTWSTSSWASTYLPCHSWLTTSKVCSEQCFKRHFRYCLDSPIYYQSIPSLLPVAHIGLTGIIFTTFLTLSY